MSCFDWNATLETGYGVVDEQHRRLFALANELNGCALAEEPDADRVAAAVYGLTDYVVEHFAAEEALMRLYDYDETGVHRMLHDQLTRDVLSLAARYFNGEELRPDAIAVFVADWLREHILEQDRRLVEHVHASSGAESGGTGEEGDDERLGGE